MRGSRFMQLGRSSLRFTLAAAAVALLAGGAGLWLAHALDRPPVLQSGTWLDRPRAIAPFELRDDRQRPFTQLDLRGAPTLMFFGFTNCPDLCPTTLATLAEVLRAKPLPGLKVLFVSVDPERDGPAVMHQYVTAFGPEFSGLTGPEAALAPLARSLSVAYQRVALPDGGYTMDHSAAVYLIDPKGRFVAVFTPPFSSHQMALDLASLASRFAP
jgi:protein SCO1/2